MGRLGAPLHCLCPFTAHVCPMEGRDDRGIPQFDARTCHVVRSVSPLKRACTVALLGAVCLYVWWNGCWCACSSTGGGGGFHAVVCVFCTDGSGLRDWPCPAVSRHCTIKKKGYRTVIFACCIRPHPCNNLFNPSCVPCLSWWPNICCRTMAIG